MKKDLILIVGPTAAGKTAISIEVAKKINGEIISADSMQIYKYMDIGTAKVTKNEMDGINHYMIDEVFPNEDYSVSDFKESAYNYIDKIYTKGKLPLVVGGTGLYINSLVYNLDFTQAVSNPKLREKYYNIAEEKGNHYIHELLKEVDEKSYLRIHENDTKRIVRALEIYYETGKPMSKKYNKLREPNPDFNIIIFGITMDRKKLYKRINYRVDLMIEEGLVDEVKSLLEKGYDKELVSLQGLGYKEIIRYLEGNMTLEEAVELLKRDTRRFAKRQLTWFRRDDRIKWIDLDKYKNKEDATKQIISIINDKINMKGR
ncbi:tRNA (adenosine(37)-N6)-dimethylallyltransferase MiaA [Clostridium sp. D2Q-11]|uniref:tRNA dimethylallyltransferase n=1 Tax=Anaeromonas frigoriresistens TaxID=2683708 RepID=A0A942UXI7_9FIRM|nr:tRNA (adenosine(37)-N6)-dimethylallyltransferase MiaA [Anaeromonas frigoriresistens]MBS4539925.1 tRNA (adenosine(37)-N6)-dimethylallyltransferase MiaA [Anaeromonas frigoriresistens]